MMAKLNVGDEMLHEGEISNSFCEKIEVVHGYIFGYVIGMEVITNCLL